MDTRPTWCIDIICVKKKARTSLISSRVVICAFLHCLHNSGESHNRIVALEVANGYRNLPAFVGYSKLGFVYDPFFLPDSNTFPIIENQVHLPMTIELHGHALDEFLMRGLGSKQVTLDPHDESGILKLVELGNDTNNCAKDNL